MIPTKPLAIYLIAALAAVCGTLQQAAAFVGWDFISIWCIDDGLEYPCSAWSAQALADDTNIENDPLTAQRALPASPRHRCAQRRYSRRHAGNRYVWI